MKAKIKKLKKEIKKIKLEHKVLQDKIWISKQSKIYALRDKIRKIQQGE